MVNVNAVNTEMKADSLSPTMSVQRLSGNESFLQIRFFLSLNVLSREIWIKRKY